MSDLVRFGVAMERPLLTAFDERIASRGYENRSEALRDLVRADLTRAAWDGGAVVAGTLSVVYLRRQIEHVARIVDAERAPTGVVVSTVSVTVDDSRQLEVFVLWGPASQLSGLAGRLGGARGVLSAELAISCAAPPRFASGAAGAATTAAREAAARTDASKDAG